MKQKDRLFSEYFEKIEKQKKEIQKRIIGLPKFIESLFICFYSHSERKLGPHLLVEGKVGKGKTAVLATFAKTISDANFSRIQFTPDLKPMDLIRIVDQREDKTLEFYKGPLFANLVLADEINRAHEKTRSALLEAMGEKQVTIGRDTCLLEEPFFVMATQNPIDIEGTFMLGAAQLDRFMMKIYTESLSVNEELIIVKTHEEKDPEVKAVITKSEVLDIQKFIRENVRVSENIRRDIVLLIRAMRINGGIVDPSEFYLLPEGERGCLYLERGAKTRAFLKGRDYVTFEDVTVLTLPILNHRIGFKCALSDTEKIARTSEMLSKAIDKVLEYGASGL